MLNNFDNAFLSRYKGKNKLLELFYWVPNGTVTYLGLQLLFIARQESVEQVLIDFYKLFKDYSTNE